MTIQTFAFVISCITFLAAGANVTAEALIQSGVRLASSNESGLSVSSGDSRINIINGDPHMNRHRNIRTNRQDYAFYDVQQESQQTRINLSSDSLRKPHILKVSTPTAGEQLTGQIKVDGRVVQSLKNNSTQINLSHLLSQGTHKIEILGNYPENSSVQVEFSGPNTQVVQQTAGSGTIRQILIVDVE